MNDTDPEKIEKLFNPRINKKGDYVTVTLPGTGTTVELMYEEFMALRDTFAALVARRELETRIDQITEDMGISYESMRINRDEARLAALTTEANTLNDSTHGASHDEETEKS